MIESVKRTMPDANLIQVSDEFTKMHDGVDKFIQWHYDGRLPYFICKTRSGIDIDEYIAIDDDVIVDKPLYHLMENEFDIALCTRQKNGDGANKLLQEKCPYNTGVVVVRSKDFWIDCLKLLPAMKLHWQDWFGEQIAIAEVAKSNKYKIMEIEGYLYNRTPKKPAEKSGEVYVWHYKGNRKNWMKYHGTN
jgi:hypothetical protein